MMSSTICFTRGSVRLASAKVKSLWAMMEDYSLHLFRMRNEAYDLLVAVQHDDGRSDMMIRGVWLLGDSESLELGLGLHNRCVGTRVVSGRAIGRIMSGTHTSCDDIAI